jgi:hypothetical protein
VAATAVLLAAGLTAVLVTRGGGGGAGAATTDASTGTAKVERRDLVVTDSYDGTLGFGAARPYVTDRAGVVTTVAAAGTTVAAGSSLFSIDFEPTVVLVGAVPAYRALDTEANDGPDVQQLEQALVDLGYGSGVTVDQAFTSGTAAAVKRWETALGRTDPDGRVELGDIAFASGPVRVGTISADVGTRVQDGTTVLEATPTVHVVTVDLEASRSNELEPGTVVDMTMPDSTATTGTVATIGTEAAASDDSNGGPGGGSEPTVPVTITLDHPDAAGSFDTGSVKVAIERSRDDGVLAVPVTALLALAEGGYAVEVVETSSSHRLVGVEVGTHADGWVGITGDGIAEGVKVVVPA